jgi:hypothetical protein
MKYILFLFYFISTFLINAQTANHDLEMQVLKETLPQLLNENPNSIVYYLKGGKFYDMMIKINKNNSQFDKSIDTAKVRADLDRLSDSIYVVLEHNKIRVTLSETLFAYNYKPLKEEMSDGSKETTDLRNSETWEGTKEFLTEVFQGDFEYYGLDRPVDLEFIDLINLQIKLGSKDQKINLPDLNNSYYEFCTKKEIEKDTTSGRTINAICLYRPVFNKNKDKACYLFTFQAANGPFREFIFVEKINGTWYFVESYGSHLIDGDENY